MAERRPRSEEGGRDTFVCSGEFQWGLGSSCTATAGVREVHVKNVAPSRGVCMEHSSPSLMQGKVAMDIFSQTLAKERRGL